MVLEENEKIQYHYGRSRETMIQIHQSTYEHRAQFKKE